MTQRPREKAMWIWMQRPDLSIVISREPQGLPVATWNKVTGMEQILSQNFQKELTLLTPSLWISSLQIVGQSISSLSDPVYSNLLQYLRNQIPQLV